MILKESEIDERKIASFVGEPIRFDWKNPKTIGSAGLYLKSFINSTEDLKVIKIDSKCNFEERTNGLILHTTFSNKRSLILLPKNEILEISLFRGKETIDPIPFYPMWILLKLGVSVLKARYFGLRKGQYKIESAELRITTNKYELEFIANGFLFERFLNFFKKEEYEEKLKVIVQE